MHISETRIDSSIKRCSRSNDCHADNFIMVRIAGKSTCDTFAESRQVRLNEKLYLRYAQLHLRYAQICVVNYGEGGHFL